VLVDCCIGAAGLLTHLSGQLPRYLYVVLALAHVVFVGAAFAWENNLAFSQVSRLGAAIDIVAAEEVAGEIAGEGVG
jgi:hypothetical protein